MVTQIDQVEAYVKQELDKAEESHAADLTVKLRTMKFELLAEFKAMVAEGDAQRQTKDEALRAWV